MVLEKILDLNGPQLEVIAAGTVVYAALFAAEGVGLLFEMTWAEYLTLVETAGFVPMELYKIIQRVSAAKCAVLVLNVAVIIYLARCATPAMKRRLGVIRAAYVDNRAERTLA